MRFLLDTHTYLWWLSSPEKIGSEAKQIMMNDDFEILVSTASFWELAVKSSLGKITLSEDVAELAQGLSDEGFRLLNIDPKHCGAVVSLPFHHRDPFDRMLVAQALVEDLTLLTRDKEIPAYPIKVAW